MSRIAPFLWFDGQAEEAARFYCSIFPNSRILTGVPDADAAPKAKVMAVGFELDGLSFTALNGGPGEAFTAAISFTVGCEMQGEIDRYWDALCEGGTPQRCGWVKDRFGISWQIVPRLLGEALGDPDRARAARAMAAMLGMTRIDLAAIRDA